MPEPVIERLANGLTLSVVEVSVSHQVLVSLLVRVGSRFEQAAANGVSHFLEHMLFRGCAAYPDSGALFQAFEQAGSVPNAVTEVEYTEFYFTAHPAHVDSGLATLAGMIREPLFPELERERGIVLDEILYDYDAQGELIHPGALTAALLWGEHPLGLSVTGTPETLPRLGRPLLENHHRKYYTPENAVLSLAGRVSAPEMVALAGRFFGDWAPGRGPQAPPPLPHPFPGGEGGPAEGGAAEGGEAEGGAPRVHLVPHTDNQFQVQLTFPAPGYTAPEDPALGLLGRLLDDGPNTRLQMEVREKRGLAYHIGAGYSGFHDAGQFDISTSVQPENLGEVLDAVVGCLAAFRDHGPAPEELARAKQRHRFDLDFERDSLSAALARWGWALLYTTPRGEEDEWARVEAVTAAEIQHLAGRMFRPGAAHLVAVGPVKRAAERAVARALRAL